MSTAFDASSDPIQAQNSPRGRQSRRSSVARGVPSPSASPPSMPISGIVDQEHFLTSSSSMSSDSLPVKEVNTVVDDGFAAAAGEDFQLENGETGKKPVWNKPSNGAAAKAVGAVMGAELWPALSESARASPKSPTYSLKPLSHGSVSISQEDLTGGSLSSPKEVGSSISSAKSVSNHVIPSRPKRESTKHSSGSSSPHMPSTDNISQTPLPQHGSVVDAMTHSTGKLSVGEPSRDNNTKNKDNGQRGGSYSANETQPQQQRTYRRNNSGPLTRGDGSYHHGGRRDQEHGGKQDWGHRSFNNRESHGSQQRTGSRPFLRGPAPNTPFVPPPPVAVRPFVAPVVYTEMPSPVFYVPGPHPDSLTPMSMVPMPSMFFPMHDPHLPTKIVMQLTDNIQLILDVIKSSNAVEVQGDKVRRKGDWMKWIMPPPQTTVMSPQSVNGFSPNMLATLDEKPAK
ncbi:hypothetical protein SASPL_154754 [Salvia splendens]|uniref:La-related protein 1 n=1 Tax=Salvia splendens TaxID=180675 RepID=A0A8X8YYZ4_SALSN|nr:hypothetical protein SASPL_154754 [Salvia splendens]